MLITCDDKNPSANKSGELSTKNCRKVDSYLPLATDILLYYNKFAKSSFTLNMLFENSDSSRVE